MNKYNLLIEKYNKLYDYCKIIEIKNNILKNIVNRYINQLVYIEI